MVDRLLSLIARLPPGSVSTHPGELAERARDRRAVAMLRERRGERGASPGAVVFPTTSEQVAAVLAWAGETGTPVVPRGGGTGMAGGAEALPWSVVVDTSRLNRVIVVDGVSQTVRVEAGVRGGKLEAALNGTGFTLGHEMPTFELSTVGGWIAGGAEGDLFAGFGPLTDRVLGATVALAGGEVLRLDRTVTPDMLFGGPGLLFGSLGTLAVITEATLSVARLIRGLAWEVLRPHSFEAAVGVAREVVQRALRPLVLVVLDEDDVRFVYGAGSGQEGPLVLIGLDADSPATAAARFDLQRLSPEFGARPLGHAVAEHWWNRKGDVLPWYEGVMGPERSLGPGVVADWLTVAGTWRSIPGIYERVRGALLEEAGAVRCRLVHPASSGAGLHFLFVVRRETDQDVEPAYLRAIDQARTACADAGGFASPGPFLEYGSSGLAGTDGGRSRILEALKRDLDPAGLLNPGKPWAGGASEPSGRVPGPAGGVPEPAGGVPGGAGGVPL
jgi:alkyldihydroxyacetonephosphate synthase